MSEYILEPIKWFAELFAQADKRQKEINKTKKGPIDKLNDYLEDPKTQAMICKTNKKMLDLRTKQLKHFNELVAAAMANPAQQKRRPDGSQVLILIDNSRKYTQAEVDQGIGKQIYTSSQIKEHRTVLLRDIKSYKKAYEACVPKKPTGGGGGGASTKSPDNTASKEKAKDMIYNVGSVVESYFKKGEALITKDTNGNTAINNNANGVVEKLDAYIFEANTPTQVADANELWKAATSSKGMIQSWTVPNSRPAGADSYLGEGNAAWQSDAFLQKYGFQFLYNPTSVSMEYSGVGEVDIAMEVSGSEDFNSLATTTTQSTISFDLLINRMNDLKYLTSPGKLRDGVDPKIWAGRTPGDADFKEIYNKGTMYDVEYLLKTLLGFELTTQFRGKSSDIGFVSPRPVELHLGKSLRYVGTINSFSVTHAIFDWRMVPLFTNLRVTFNRIPDYGGYNAAADGAGSGATNAPSSGVDPNSYGPGKIPTAAQN